MRRLLTLLLISGLTFAGVVTPTLAQQYRIKIQWLKPNRANATYLAKYRVIGGYKKGEYAGVTTDNDSTPLYICRAFNKDNAHKGIHPGRIYHNNCYIGWDHQAYEKDNYEVLTAKSLGDGLGWVDKDENLEDAVAAGWQDNDTLYVCRASYRGSIYPGALLKRLMRCYFPWDGQELDTDQFQVLVFKRGESTN